MRANPIDVALNAIFKFNLRFVAGGADFCYVARQMSHLAGTKFTTRLRFNVDLEQLGKNLLDFANRCSFAAADIDRESIKLVAFSREHIRARNVFNE